MSKFITLPLDVLRGPAHVGRSIEKWGTLGNHNKHSYQIRLLNHGHKMYARYLNVNCYRK